MRCRHCYVSASPSHGELMATETLNRAIDLLEHVGIRDVRLTGGEPTIHPEFDKIVDRLHCAGASVGLTSNGKRLLRRNDAAQLLRKLSRCWISVYGPTRELHRSVGGESAADLDSIIAWVGNFGRAGFHIGVSALLTPGSADHVVSFLGQLGQAGVHRVRLIPIQPDGRATSAFSIDWSDWPRELGELVALLRSQSSGDRFTTFTINDMCDFGEGRLSPHESCLLRGRRMWSIVPNGDVFPCCFTVYDSKRRVGNIWDRDIEAALGSRWPVDSHVVPCRAFEWVALTSDAASGISCPISTLDLRSRMMASQFPTIGHTHASEPAGTSAHQVSGRRRTGDASARRGHSLPVLVFQGRAGP